MSQNKIDYPEQIYKTIDIITNKRLEALQYDITIEATIIDDKQSEKGVYTVSNGNANFIAYSKDSEYKKDDVVMVTIPQGNYNNQKIIIGKKINEEKEESPIEFKRPFSNLINITNNILSNEDQKQEYSFIANGEDYCWDINTPNLLDSTTYHSKNEDEDDHISIQLSEIGYTRIGVKADFLTTLKEYQVVSGNYGLEFVLSFSNNLLSEENIIRTFSLDSSNFFGNIYNLDIYQNQELVFDISDMENYILKQIQIYPYQRKNFKNINNEDILADDISFDNIFIKNIYVCLGTSAIDFDKDSVKITTKNSLLYSNNSEENNVKILNLQWIHKNEDSNIIKVVQEDEIPIKYHIWWYIHDRESSDLYAGAGWKRFYGCKTIMNPKTGDYLLKKEEIKNEELNLRYPEDVTDHLEDIYFFPNGNEQTQQLKVIIVKEKNNINEENAFTNNSEKYFYDKVAESPVFIFENETQVANKTTILDANALSIRYNDEQKGNYFLYNRAGNILDGEDIKIRTLTAVFDPFSEDIYEKLPLTPPYDSIKWIFPASNSMINPIKNYLNESNIEVLKEPTINDDTENKYIIIKEQTEEEKYIIRYDIKNKNFEFYAENIASNESPLTEVGYQIKNFLNYSANRNTVILEIYKNGSFYNAVINMSFSNSGVSGSKYDIRVDWSDNAFDINKGILNGQVKLFKGQNEIDLGSGQYKYSWYKVKAYGINFDSKLEDRELYYPIKNSRVKKMRQNSTNDISVKYFSNEESDEEYNASKTYYYYDINEKQFKEFQKNPNFNQDQDFKGSLLYELKKIKTRKKIIFKKFDIVEPTTDIDKAGCIEKITETLENGKIIEKIKFYYDKYYPTPRYRSFVKYNDIFIIDPWDTYNENIEYYYPIYSDEKDYNQNNNQILRIIDNEEGSFTITDEGLPIDVDYSIENKRTRTPNINAGDLYILQVTLEDFIDYPLIARFPIALKNSDLNNNNFSINGFNGPKEVRYTAFGEVDFDPSIITIEGNLKIPGDDKLNTEDKYIKLPIYSYTQNPTPDSTYLKWEIIAEKEYNPNFYPTLSPLLDSNDYSLSQKETSSEPTLKVPSVYFEDYSFYGIKISTTRYVGYSKNDHIFITSDNENALDDRLRINKDTTLWVQPILVSQDNYPSSTLNEWNGKDIIIDKDKGIIQANGFSAGKKEDDNSFTGVVLGDWSRTDTNVNLTKQTGIFGLNHGAISYALKDDGTAFFGKDGQGRIYFDGNSAQIYSANWIANTKKESYSGYYQQNKTGMMLDIDDGILKIISLKENENHFSLTFDSSDSIFSLEIDYPSIVNIWGLNANDKNSIIATEERIDHFNLSSTSPFLSIGATTKTSWTTDFQFEIFDSTIKINKDYIRINEHGGFLSSANFSPTLSPWLTDIKEIVQGKTTNIYYKGNNIEIFPDQMYNSDYHCWGDNTRFPFTGLVLDLTHGSLLLGNDAEIKGYQSGKWGSQQSNGKIPGRVFHISNGAVTKRTSENLYLSEGNAGSIIYDTRPGYFILAEEVQKGDYDTTPSYDQIFRVDWDGCVYCKELYVKNANGGWNKVTH